MKHLPLLPLILTASLFAAKPVHDPAFDAALKTGDNAAKALLKTLGGNLKKHLKAGGPADALTFCSTKAADLTYAVDQKLGDKISVARITLKPRNPANEAQGADRNVLEALQTLKDNGVKLPHRFIRETADAYVYYKPLLINKGVCLKCHGTHIDKKLKTKIDAIYAADKATGYKMGDLRGAVKVTIEK